MTSNGPNIPEMTSNGPETPEMTSNGPNGLIMPAAGRSPMDRMRVKTKWRHDLLKVV